MGLPLPLSPRPKHLPPPPLQQSPLQPQQQPPPLMIMTMKKRTRAALPLRHPVRQNQQVANPMATTGIATGQQQQLPSTLAQRQQRPPMSMIMIMNLRPAASYQQYQVPPNQQAVNPMATTGIAKGPLQVLRLSQAALRNLRVVMAPWPLPALRRQLLPLRVPPVACISSVPSRSPGSWAP